MGSKQMRRENVTDERNIDVEKDRVPKMATQFESLARDQKDNVPLHGEKAHVEIERLPVRVGGAEYYSGSDTKEREEGKIGKEKTREVHGPSLEEISNLRAMAQQNSMEAIMDAEDRYNKAKEVGILQSPQESKTMEGKDVISSKGGHSKDTTMEKSQQAKDYTSEEKAMEGKDVISSKGGEMKDTTMEKGQQAKDYTAQKAMEAKDGISSKAAALKDKTMETGVEAKDVMTSKGGALMQKTMQAKDKIVDTTLTAAGYVGEKAVAAKDVTVESGKRVVPEVKDKAVVAGWGAAHYTLEKMAEATKAVANVTASVAGYAKDTVVSTEEKAAEYAARKQAEAKKASYDNKGEVEGGGESFLMSKEQPETREKAVEILPCEKSKPSFQGEEKHQKGVTEVEQKGGGGGGGGVFHAIGETIVEIGQTTGELLVGHTDQTRGNEEPYTGTGEEGI